MGERTGAGWEIVRGFRQQISMPDRGRWRKQASKSRKRVLRTGPTERNAGHSSLSCFENLSRDSFDSSVLTCLDDFEYSFAFKPWNGSRSFPRLSDCSK